MSKIALGTAQFGMSYGISNNSGQILDSEIDRILEYAFLNGIDTLDTAINYGSSEDSLGRFGVDMFQIVTKLPSIPLDVSNVREWIRQQIFNSLKRLNLKKIYGVLLHDPIQLMGSFGVDIYAELISFQEQGYIKKIGISMYDPNQLTALIPQYHFDIIQIPLNIFDRRFINSDWLKFLKDDGVEIHSRSAFLQGLLLMPRDLLPEKFSYWKNYFDSWYGWLEKKGITPIQAALNFVLSNPDIDKVIIGVDSLAHLKGIIRAAHSYAPGIIPDLSIEDERLINPGNW